MKINSSSQHVHLALGLYEKNISHYLGLLNYPSNICKAWNLKKLSVIFFLEKKTQEST